MQETTDSRGYVPLLFAAIVAALYIGFMIPYQIFTSPASIETFAETVMEKTGLSVDFSMVLPHLICFGAALLFNFLSAVCLKRFLALIAIVLYGVSIALFYPYCPFAAAAIFFTLIGIFRIPGRKKAKSEPQPE